MWAPIVLHVSPSKSITKHSPRANDTEHITEEECDDEILDLVPARNFHSCKHFLKHHSQFDVSSSPFDAVRIDDIILHEEYLHFRRKMTVILPKYFVNFVQLRLHRTNSSHLPWFPTADRRCSRSSWPCEHQARMSDPILIFLCCTNNCYINHF